MSRMKEITVSRSEITQSIIAMMETAGIDWVKPWTSRGMAINPITNHTYRGINTIILGTQAELHGYPSNEWAGFVQWGDKDCRVRKGERGTKIVIYNVREDDDGRQIPFIGQRAVFNAAQVDGYEPVPKKIDFVGVEEAEQMSMMVGADIRWGASHAYYSPKLDFVGMPHREDFHDAMSCYATLFHELGHWTGHETRLNRNLTGTFGDPEYALEELIAELTSAFLCADYGISARPREDHAKYLNCWMRALKDNDNTIFMASSKASRASEYLHARAV